jgi:putative methyltransferase (TIGR04325 family)
VTLIEQLHRRVDGLASLPGIGALVHRQAREAFVANRDQNMFFGVHENWEEAVAAAAAFGQAGYDNSNSAQLYDYRTRIDPHDYPSLYWISRSLDEGMNSVFDVGGAIGIKFIAFREHLKRWPSLQWLVQDVPAMAEHGRMLALERGDAAQLRFTDCFEDGEGVDLLFASGVLQYLPKTLGELLRSYHKLPRRIVVNTAAIHPAHSFFTVNSIGTAFCPYRVQTQAELVRGLTGVSAARVVGQPGQTDGGGSQSRSQSGPLQRLLFRLDQVGLLYGPTRRQLRRPSVTAARSDRLHR